MNRAITSLAFLIISLAVGLLTGCSDGPKESSNSDSSAVDSMAKEKAISELKATTGNDVKGSVYFTKTDNGIQISAVVSALTPGQHGFHIHAKGDCSSGDGKSAGGHFNPHSVDHGGADAKIRHVGDLGNITADSFGNAKYERIDTMISFNGVNNIIGKGVIIHAGTDDLTSQPTGAAGARVACGVIKKVN